MKDSIHFDPNLKYHTVGGRVVYGGGGIMPDVFVPADSSGFSKYLVDLRRTMLLYDYTFDFMDKHREEMKKLNNYKEVLAYLKRFDLVEEMADYAEKNGLKKDRKGIRDSYEESKAALGKGDYSQYASQNRDFHSEIWAAAGNKKMENMIAELWNGLSMGNMVTEQEYAKISIEEHGRIMDAIAAGDGERAKKEMYAHLMRSRDDMLTYYQ